MEILNFTFLSCNNSFIDEELKKLYLAVAEIC